MTHHKDWLSALRTGEDAAFVEAYHHFRPDFLRFAGSLLQEAPETLLDLYQDAMIVVYMNARQGKIQHLDDGLRPYLYGVGKNLIRRRAFKRKREPTFDPSDGVFMENLDFSMLLPEEDATTDVLKTALHHLDEKCRGIIEGFYLRGLSMENLRDQFGYASEEVARMTKMRCLKKIRAMFASLGA